MQPKFLVDTMVMFVLLMQVPINKKKQEQEKNLKNDNYETNEQRKNFFVSSRKQYEEGKKVGKN